jgi:CubicO group peptidase (beta-lactamase class C family)
VLTHQTGFPNWRNGKLRFEFEPGTKFQYSGEGFEYVRKALESKFEKTLVQLSDSILFKPLGMKDTRYCFDKDMDTTLYAIPHNAQGNKIEISIRDRGVNAAALLLTTIEDYSKFMVYVMNGAGLSPSLYHDMIRSQAAERKHVGRGLGWEIVSDLSHGEFTLQHGGSNAGVKTMCIILPKSKRGVVVFTNSDNGMTVYNNVIREALDEGQQILNFTNGLIQYTTIKLTNEILEQYIGTYARSDLNGWKIHITKEGDLLKVSGESLPVMEFVPYSEDKFFMKGYGFQYEFIKDESNKVIQLNISENGKLLLTAKKIK